MPTTRRRRSRTFCTSALAPIGRCFLSAGDERRSAWSPRRMTLATMVSPKASVLHATPHGDTWEKPVGLLPFCPRSLSRPRRSPALGEGGSASSPGSNFLAVSLNAMYVRFRSGSVIAVPLHARISGVATVTDGDTLKFGPERILLHGIDAPESAQRCRARWPNMGLRHRGHPGASQPHRRPAGRVR